MVFFTCNNCGEAVKKTSIEKHYNMRCRNNPKNVSCMDCQKDFYDEEYVAHTKCITEAEKYSGKNYVAKEKKNSGQKKQEAWMDIVRSILESSEYQLSAQTRKIFMKLQNFENVPSKKAKFQNFVVKCLRIHIKQAEPVWEILEKELENIKKIKQQQVTATKAAIKESMEAKETEDTEKNGLKRKLEDVNVDEVKVEKKKKKKSEKADISEENGEAESTEDKDAFQWSTVLEKIVGKHSDGLTLDKLKKNLLKKYKNKLNLAELNEKQQKKFDKKFTKTLKKCPAIQVDGETARPC